MPATLDTLLADEVGRIAAPRLRFEIDAEFTLGIERGCDEDELGAVVVKEEDILGREAATAEFLLNGASGKSSEIL
jgi:hypothetical protein